MRCGVGTLGDVELARLRLDELVNAWVTDRNTPFQIALLGIFDPGPLLRQDGTVDVPRIRKELAARARRLPTLGRRVVWTHVGEGRPLWAADPSFDAESHITSVPLPPGADLANWAASRVVRPLDANRPLWRAEVVDGLPDGQFAVLIVVHHVVADGHAGVAIAGSLLDTHPDAVVAEPPAPAVPPLPSHRELLRRRMQEIGTAIIAPQAPTAGRLGRLRGGLGQIRAVLADVGTPEPATSLPREVGPGRTMAVVRQPLAELQRTGHQLGVTVNDLLLAAVTGGLRELLTARGDLGPGLVLRTTVPAATGRPGQVMGLLVVELPVGEPDPLRRLALISRSTSMGKARLRAARGDVFDVYLPLPVARVVMRRARRYGSSRISLSVTDVPGPPVRLWLAGARLLAAVPVAPLVPLVPLSVAALSYAGELAVSVNADDTVSDLEVLADGMGRSFAALRNLTESGGRLPRLPAPLVGRGRDVVECVVDIDRAADDVFAYCTDPSHEPEWNPELIAVQKLTGGPVGQGTRYRMQFRRGVRDSVVEYLGFEKPRSWTATSTSAHLDVRFEGEVVPDAGRSHLRFRARLLPRGVLRPLAPMRRRLLRRRWERDLAVMRSELEKSASGPAAASAVSATGTR